MCISLGLCHDDTQSDFQHFKELQLQRDYPTLSPNMMNEFKSKTFQQHQIKEKYNLHYCCLAEGFQYRSFDSMADEHSYLFERQQK
jgi:hypothetical protein